MELELEGVDAELRAGYVTAARLPVWRLTTIGPDLFRLDAFGVTPHPVYMGFRPLSLRIPRGETAVWEWSMQEGVGAVTEDGELQLLVSGDPSTRRR